MAQDPIRPRAHRDRCASAIFAPLENLGLIVVDEEHETSYKQEEAPRYHARDVAVVRGKLESCVVLLGTATPSLESYYNATRGKYRLLNLTQRVDDNQMPLIRVVDLRNEKRKAKSLTISATSCTPRSSRGLRNASRRSSF
jgi:primosomal protein N' (replication factor Y)